MEGSKENRLGPGLNRKAATRRIPPAMIADTPIRYLRSGEASVSHWSMAQCTARKFASRAAQAHTHFAEARRFRNLSNTNSAVLPRAKI